MKEFLRKLSAQIIKHKVSLTIVLLLALFARTYHEDVLQLYVGSKVVKLYGDRSGGTGFFVKGKSGKTYIMTNRHVCETSGDSEYLTAKRGESVVGVKVKIIKKSDNHDLCLVESFDLTQGLRVANSIYKNETVMAIGHPGLEHLIASKGRFIANTIISVPVGVNLTEEDKCPGVLVPVRSMFVFNVCIIKYVSSRIFLYIKPGSSGSPLVDFFGNIVGVIFAGDRGDHLKSYAVPLHYVKDFLKDY